MNKKYFDSRKGSVEATINTIRSEQKTIVKEEPKVSLQPKSYFGQKKDSLADVAAKVVSESNEELQEVKYTIGYEIDSDDPIDDKYTGDDEMSVNASSSRDAAKKFGQEMNKLVKKAGQRSKAILKIGMTSFEDNNRDYNASEINKLDDYANDFIYKGIYDSYLIKAEELKDMEDYREKSKTLQSIQNDPKQMNDPQMRDAVMKRKFKLSKELSDLKAKEQRQQARARQKPIAAEVEPDTYVKEEISESPFAVSYSGTKTSDRKQRGANIITQKTGTIKVDAKDEDSAKKLVSKILDKRMNLRRYDIDRVRAEDFKTFREGLQPGFAVRYLDPKNGKRFAVAYKIKKDADDKAAQLKKDGAKDISITKHTINFKEDREIAEGFEGHTLSFLKRKGFNVARFSYGKLLVPKSDVEDVKKLLKKETEKVNGDVTVMPNAIIGEAKEEVLDEGLQLSKLVGKSIAHLEMYVELANDIKKEYFKTNSQVSMFIKAKADQVLRSVPSLVKDLRKPGIWSEQVELDEVNEDASDMAQAKATGTQKRIADLTTNINDKEDRARNINPGDKNKVAIHKADINHMKLKLSDLKDKLRTDRHKRAMAAQNEPETDTSGKPNKKKEITENE